MNTTTYFTSQVLAAALKVAEEDFLSCPDWTRETCDGSLVAAIEDGNVLLYVNPAREGGGYDTSKSFPVKAGRQTVAGCPSYHGTVDYIPIAPKRQS